VRTAISRRERVITQLRLDYITCRKYY